MYSENDLYKLLKKIKFNEDFIIIHSDFFNFRNFSVNLYKFWEILKKTLGENKTFIFPTFTFSFSKKKVWLYKESKSETGSLSEFFRKYISEKRTIHPIHSVAISGPHSTEVPDHKCRSSFGKNSTWQWLCENKNVGNLSLGIGLNGGATICHYSEEIFGVDYRKYINLKGKVFDEKDNLVKKKFQYYAIKNSKSFKIANYWKKCESGLLKNKIFIPYKNIYKIPIFKMNTNLATNYILENLKQNNNFLAKIIKI